MSPAEIAHMFRLIKTDNKAILLYFSLLCLLKKQNKILFLFWSLLGGGGDIGQQSDRNHNFWWH